MLICKLINVAFCVVLFLKEEPMDTDQSSNILSSIQSEVAKYQMLIEEENQKLKRYKVHYILILNGFLK